MSGPEVIKIILNSFEHEFCNPYKQMRQFSCSEQQTMLFVMVINFKMPTFKAFFPLVTAYTGGFSQAWSGLHVNTCLCVRLVHAED